MNLTNASYLIKIGTKNFTERYYRDRKGWLKVSARGRKFRMTAEQVLNHLLRRATVGDAIDVDVADVLEDGVRADNEGIGDLLAFPSIGFVGGHSDIRVAFLFVTAIMLVSGFIWLAGMKFLAADTAAVEKATAA